MLFCVMSVCVGFTVYMYILLSSLGSKVSQHFAGVKIIVFNPPKTATLNRYGSCCD